MEALVIAAIICAVYMAWNIGANDVANSMADAVGSKSISIFWAVVLAGIFNFLGAVLVGGNVTDTVRKGIIDTQAFSEDPYTLAYGMVCAILAAAIALNVASYFGFPVSTTHAIVGGIVGFGILQAGISHIHWGTFSKIVASWFLSPVAGGVSAFFIFKLISRHILSVENPMTAARKGIPICAFFTFCILVLATIYKGLKNLHLNLNAPKAISFAIAGGLTAAGIYYLILNRRKMGGAKQLSWDEQLGKVEKNFALLVVITSSTVAFAHGANDVANAVGPLAAVVEIVKTGTVPGQVPVSLWILMLGGFGIAAGLACFGYRVMKMVGTKITDITPSRGVAADIGGMATVLVCSKLGLPISTTHTLVGAIIGVGLARGITGINRKIVGSIFVSWLATVPLAALLTIVLYLIGDWLIF